MVWQDSSLCNPPNSPKDLVVNKCVLVELVRLNKGLTKIRGGAEAAKCLTLENCRTIGRKPLVAAVSFPMAASQFAADEVCVLLWASFCSTSLIPTNHPLATDNLLPDICFPGHGCPLGKVDMLCEHAGVPHTFLVVFYISFCFPCYCHHLCTAPQHPPTAPFCQLCDKVVIKQRGLPKQIQWRS